MSKRALMILSWLRTDKNDFERGYTLGFLNAILEGLAPWEAQYLHVIAGHRALGVSA